MMQHYISLLLKHRRLVLSGPSGTGKSYLASRLAEYLVDRSAREVTDGIVVTFNMHRQSCKVARKWCPMWMCTAAGHLVLHVLIFLSVAASLLRSYSFIFPTWPIRSIGKPARPMCRWSSFWMIFTTRLPSASWSMVLLPVNITNGKLHLCTLNMAAKLPQPSFNKTWTLMSFSPSVLTSSEPVISRWRWRRTTVFISASGWLKG